MKTLKPFVTALCLVAALAFVVPTAAFADDGGPQGTKNSVPKPPPPPPSNDWQEVVWWLLTRGL